MFDIYWIGCIGLVLLHWFVLLLARSLSFFHENGTETEIPPADSRQLWLSFLGSARSLTNKKALDVGHYSRITSRVVALPLGWRALAMHGTSIYIPCCATTWFDWDLLNSKLFHASILPQPLSSIFLYLCLKVPVLVKAFASIIHTRAVSVLYSLCNVRLLLGSFLLVFFCVTLCNILCSGFFVLAVSCTFNEVA